MAYSFPEEVTFDITGRKKSQEGKSIPGQDPGMCKGPVMDQSAASRRQRQAHAASTEPRG